MVSSRDAALAVLTAVIAALTAASVRFTFLIPARTSAAGGASDAASYLAARAARSAFEAGVHQTRTNKPSPTTNTEADTPTSQRFPGAALEHIIA